MENQEPIVPNHQPVSQEDFIKDLLQQAVPLFKDLQEQKMAVQKLQIEKDSETQQAEFVVLNKVDARDKYYKVIIVSLCLAALCVVAFIDKLQGVSPIIGVIIGLVLKSNSLQDFRGGSDKKEES
jgi:hypothetical protein